MMGRFGCHDLLRTRDDETDETSKRGEIALLPRDEFLLGEGEEILIQGRLDAIMIGIVRLDDRLPG